MATELDFARLYRDHAEDVRRFALYLSGDPDAASDIVSETFVRVWGARERVEIRSVRGYLLAIARNLYLAGQRRDRRRAPLPETIRDPGPHADEIRAARGELERVLRQLQELPEIDRAALLLRATEELPYEEIAAVLGISPVVARVKVHRARARLSAAREESDR